MANKKAKIVSTVDMDIDGRIHTIDGVDYNVRQLTLVEHPDLDKLDWWDQDEFIKKTEAALLKSLKVTHVIDYENFGDDKEHTVRKFLALDDAK